MNTKVKERSASKLRKEGPRITREKKTIQCMIAIYCRGLHDQSRRKEELCQECAELQRYALNRLTYCRFGETKTSCRGCKVHCYASDYQQRVRKIMRYAGPRMIWRHPWLTVRHMMDEKRSK